MWSELILPVKQFLFAFALVVPCLGNPDLLPGMGAYKRVQFNAAGRIDVKTVNTGSNAREQKESKDRDQGDGDKKPRLIPLSYVADTSNLVHDGDFDAEKSGLLLHQYLNKVYKLYPDLKTINELRGEVLYKDPLVEKLNPYRRDETPAGLFSSLSTINRFKHDNSELDKQLSSKFSLDPKEVWDYTKPTEPPLSEINDKISNSLDQEEANSLETYGNLGDNYEEDYDDDENENNGNINNTKRKNLAPLF